MSGHDTVGRMIPFQAFECLSNTRTLLSQGKNNTIISAARGVRAAQPPPAGEGSPLEAPPEARKIPIVVSSLLRIRS